MCASKGFRLEAGLGLDVGLYVVDRRRDGLVFFPEGSPAAVGRSVWIPTRTLETIRADDSRVTPPPPWIVRVHQVMRMLDASDVELDIDEAGRRHARIGCRGLDLDALGRLRSTLGPLEPTLEIQPGSMSRILVVFLVHEPN